MSPKRAAELVKSIGPAPLEVGDKAFWAKCTVCGHIWPAAFYPMEMARMARLLSSCACPKCGDRKSVGVAKQHNGILQEPMSAGAP